MVHFVGDMHQPLHTGNREDDRGGNLQPIKSVLGKDEDRLNLHKVWDGHLVNAVKGDLTNDDFVNASSANQGRGPRRSGARAKSKIGRGNRTRSALGTLSI